MPMKVTTGRRGRSMRVRNWNGCDGSSTTRTQRISTPADVPVRQVSPGWLGRSVPGPGPTAVPPATPLTRYIPEVVAEVVAGLVERIPDGTWQRTCESQ